MNVMVQDAVMMILVSLCCVGTIWWVIIFDWGGWLTDGKPNQSPPDNPPEPPGPPPAPIEWMDSLLTSVGPTPDWDAELAQLVEQDGASTSVEAFHLWSSRVAKLRNAE